MKNNNKSKIIILLFTIILSLGISLAVPYYMYVHSDLRDNMMSTGLVSISYDQASTVDLAGTSPVIDEVGLQNTPYEFTVENTSLVPLDLNIVLDVDSSTNIDLEAVRYGLYINGTLIKVDHVDDEDLTLYTYSNFLSGETLECSLVFWIDYYYEEASRTFVASIEVNGKNVDIIPATPLIVTLDPDSGSVSPTTKQVMYGEKYGSLPTPTKSGYSFLGWNGKNMFSPLTIGYMFNMSSGAIQSSGASAVTDYIEVDFDTNPAYFLTLSTDYKMMVGAYNANHEYMGRNTGAARSTLTVRSTTFSSNTTSADGPIRYIRIRIYRDSSVSGVIDDVNNYQFQMEIGTEATTYEPYIITNNTDVVQNSNHTLKAIFEAE